MYAISGTLFIVATYCAAVWLGYCIGQERGLERGRTSRYHDR